MRSTVLARGAFAAALLLSACGQTPPSTPDAGPCTDNAQCGAGRVCSAGACVAVCHSDGDCAGGLACRAGLCERAGCVVAADCASGLICSGGQCSEAPSAAQVASCRIVPDGALVALGAPLQLATLALDAAGRALPFRAFTWSAQGGQIAQDGVFSSAAAGTARVRAAAGATSCEASLRVLPAPPAGALRVVVAEEVSSRPVARAEVLLSDGRTAQTDADGVATFAPAPWGAFDVHAFAVHHDFASIVGASGGDVLVPVRHHVIDPRLLPGLTGRIDAAAFARLPGAEQPVHLAFAGASLPGGPLDFSLDHFTGFGPGKAFRIGGEDHFFGLPAGTVVGVGALQADGGRFDVNAAPGPRAVWAVAGNFGVGDLAEAIRPGSLDVGKLLGNVARKRDGLRMALHAAVDVPSGARPSNTPYQAVSLSFEHRFGRTARVRMPDLPAGVRGAIAVGGAADPALGFVPLGLAGGVAEQGSSRVIDAACAESSPACVGTVTLPLVAEAAGLEGAPFVLAAIALDDRSEGGTYAGFGTGLGNHHFAVSGLVRAGRPPGVGESVAFDQPFPALPDASAMGLDAAARRISLPASQPFAQLARVDLVANHGLVWRFWAAPGAVRTVIDVPRVPPFGGYVEGSAFDPLRSESVDIWANQGPPYAQLVSAALDDGSVRFADLLRPGARSLDRLGLSARSFTVATLPLR